MKKLYLCRFTHKETKEVFYKIGWTKHLDDCMKRFNDSKYKDQYKNYIIEPLKSIIGDDNEIEIIEGMFQKLCPHYSVNRDIVADMSGCTETFKVSPEELKRICNTFDDLREDLRK